MTGHHFMKTTTTTTTTQQMTLISEKKTSFFRMIANQLNGRNGEIPFLYSMIIIWKKINQTAIQLFFFGNFHQIFIQSDFGIFSFQHNI